MTEQPQALIFDVQRFSVHDGPGIRTTVFFKGCPLRCRWCQNPESLERRPELLFFADRCQRSGDCLDSCRPGALRLGEGERVDRDLCDGCGLCVEACSFGAFELAGRQVEVDELLDEVRRDLPFFRSSGGGVTLSGGEATLQMEFVAAFAEGCGRLGISVGLQTCGAFRWAAFAPVLPLFDFIHYDLKLMDPQEHKRLIGVGHRGILENARRLVAQNAPVIFRFPVIPDHTDDPENLHGVASFLLELGTDQLVLLRYHSMGQIKSSRLGRPMPEKDPASRSLITDRLVRARDFMKGMGIEVTCPELS